MREMTLDEIKQTQIDLMIYLDKICRDNNIKYTMACGTLLGSVRHKGYIPWDDDIDIILVREEYDKLLKVLEKDSHPYYTVLTPEIEGYWYNYAKLNDNRTYLQEENYPSKEWIGINIDLFPVDYVPDNDSKTKYDEAIYYDWRLKFTLTDIAYANKKWYKRLAKRIARRKTVKFCREKGELYWKNKYREIINNLKETNTMSCLPSKTFRTFDKRVFDNYIEMPFENYQFMAVEKYDEMLKSEYGDYMKLPPEEERVSEHDFIAFYKE